jgi:hypothetical protein
MVRSARSSLRQAAAVAVDEAVDEAGIVDVESWKSTLGVGRSFNA